MYFEVATPSFMLKNLEVFEKLLVLQICNIDEKSFFLLSLIFHGCVSTYPHHMLQPIRTLQAPPSSATKTRKESTIGETLANFASTLMGSKPPKNNSKTKEEPKVGESFYV